MEEKSKEEHKERKKRKSSPLPHEDQPSTSKQRKISSNLSRPNRFRTYKKLSGTTDHGREFEQAMCGYYALKLATRDDVHDFELTSNNAADGKFDDVGLKITFTNGNIRRFLFQLKHKENKKNQLQLSDLKSESKNSDFGVQKYINSILAMNLGDDTVCILSTNSSTNFKGNVQLKDEVSIEQRNHLEFEDLLVNTEEGQKNSIFEIKSGNLKQPFYFFTSQMNVQKTERIVKLLLRSLLECDIHGAFTSYIKNWWSGKFILTKHDIIAKITELALLQHLKTLTDKKCNEKTDNLKQAIINFPLTIVEDSGEDIVENIWNIEDSWIDDEEFSKARNKFGLTEDQTNTTLWYLGKIPLIVNVNRSNERIIKCVMNFLVKDMGDKKIVLNGQLSRSDFEPCCTLKNLLDIVENSGEGKHEYYSYILQKFHVSLQGRGSITLENLVSIDADVAKLIGTRELLKMSQQEFLLVGKKKEKMPDFHIPRNISPIFLKPEDILDAYQSSSDTLVIVNGDEIFANNFFSNEVMNTMELSQYMSKMIDKEPENVILLSTKSKCTNRQFEEICENSKKTNIYLLQSLDDGDCILILSKGRKFQFTSTDIKKTVEESKILEHYNNSLHVFCAPPGMGKSTLMEVMYNSCSSDCLAVYVNLINYNSFLKQKPNFETMFSRFLQIDGIEDDLFTQLKEPFWQKQKLYMFLDGLDELNSQYLEHILKFVKYLSSRGGNIWASSRENIREIICQTLNVVPVDIEELNKDEQSLYIHQKLEQTYKIEEIEKITTAVFRSTDLNKSQNLLGIPLQLHIITEIFINDRQVYEDLETANFFVLTKMYKIFFNGKLKFAVNKIVDPSQEEQLGYMRNILQGYEVLALKACLDENDYENLHLYVDPDEMITFLDDLKTNGDKNGIIRKINESGEAVFEHQTYAEYFAAVFFRKNREKLVLMRDVIFSRKYENLRLLFDTMLAENHPLHLAIIYKDIESFETHIEKIDCTDEGGRTALHLACSKGQKYSAAFLNSKDPPSNFEKQTRETSCYIKMIKTLLQEGSILKQKEPLFGLDCVGYALESRCLYPIEEMLENKLLNFDDVREPFNRYWDTKTLIYCSAQFGYANLLFELIKQHPSIATEYHLLVSAVRGCFGDVCTPPREGNIRAVKILIENGAPLNFGEQKILERACRMKCFDMLRILIDHKATCNGGNTILHYLAVNTPEKFCSEIESAIKEFNIDVNARNLRGDTVLHTLCNTNFSNLVNTVACYFEDVSLTSSRYHQLLLSRKKFVQLLVDRGLVVDMPNQNGDTPLHIACKVDNPWMVEILLEHEADPNIVNKEKRNAVSLSLSAISYEHVTKVLFNKAFNVNGQNKSGMAPLHVACREGRVGRVEILLEQEGDLNLVDKGECNALHYASSSETPNQYVIKLLIDKGLNVNGQDKYGRTPLHVAYRAGCVENVDILLEQEADQNLVDKAGRNALHHASMSKTPNQHVIKLLINKGLNVNGQDQDGRVPLHVACIVGCVENVDILLDQEADINLIDKEECNALHYASGSKVPNQHVIKLLINKTFNVNGPDKDGTVPLHVACRGGCVENMDILLEHEADLNLVDKEGYNALHYASNSKIPNQHIIKLLISKGFNVNGQGQYGTAPLHIACKAGCVENVDVLLEHEADPSLVGKKEKNVLHHASESEIPNQHVIKLLINKGLNVNGQDKSGTAPLHEACRAGCVENIDILLEQEADLNLVDKEAKNALHYASLSKIPNQHVIKLLINKGFNVNGQDQYGRTPLHMACIARCVENRDILLEHEADIHLVDKDGRDPLYYASNSATPNQYDL